METSFSSDNQIELECRVCRMGPEDARPLFTPCQCSGSIGLVHQDCLEAWLVHSKKNSCELCSSTYEFEPLYAPNTPKNVPLSEMLQSLMSMAGLKMVPFIFKLLFVAFLWLGCIPFITIFVYSYCVGRELPIIFPLKIDSLWMNIRYGIVVDVALVVSFLVLVSFMDFVRLHWGPAEVPGNPVQHPFDDRRRQDVGDRHAGIGGLRQRPRRARREPNAN